MYIGEIMLILCTQLPLNKAIKTISQYLYRNIDSAYDLKHSSNMSDVYMTVYYQVPRLYQVPGRRDGYNDLHEMNIDINITTYANKIRMNITQISPEERTIGQLIIDGNDIDVDKIKKRTLSYIQGRLKKEYEGYDFIF